MKKILVGLSALAAVLMGLTGCAPASGAAASGDQGGGMGSLYSIGLIVVMVVIFYFMLIRPQRKEQKRKNEMFASMAVGDTVLTSSGFYGILIDVSDDTVIVEFGNNKNCRIPMQKAAIAAVEKPEDAVVDNKKSDVLKKEEAAAKEEAKAAEATEAAESSETTDAAETDGSGQDS